MPPTDRSVAWMRFRADEFFLTQRCTVQVQDKVTSAIKTAETWTTIFDDVPCRLLLQRQFSRNEVVDIAGMEIIGELYTLSVPQAYIIPADSRVIIENLYYDIVNVKQHLADKIFNSYICTRQEGIND